MQNELGDERVGELLMQRVTGALSAPEADALAVALARMPSGEAARWEQAAAELAAACASADPAMQEPMPSSLAAQVIGTGEAIVRAQPQVSPVSVPALTVSVGPRRSVVATWGGWMAAAAALVLWIAVPRPSSAPQTPAAVVAAPVRDGAALLRDSLLAGATPAVAIPWTATTDSSATTASGDVVWSGSAQRGVMRIAGLQPNDRRRWQYQLWIFDRTRDQKYPVDGGVFDIPAGQREILVPIDARVPVGDAVMFAITVEPAGGVVVSTRDRIALLAQRGG